MTGLESFLLAYLLNSLWQVPLLFAAAWLTTRVLRAAGPTVEHRVWVGALLLETLLPGCSLSLFARLRELSLRGGRTPLSPQEHVTVQMGPGTGLAVLHLPSHLLSIVAIAYSIIVTYFLARLLWRCRSLSAMRRQADHVLLTGEAALCWSRCCERFHIHDADLAASPKLFGPVTMGLRRKLVLLPSHMVTGLPNQDLHTVIAHEFAHMHRRDFAKNLLYEIASLPVTYHPLLWLTRERIIETREMICDGMAANLAGRSEYARSLLRLASLLVSGTSARAPHAIGIFDANTFERRLMKLTESHKEIRGVRLALTTAACLAVAVATCCSALALRVGIEAAPTHSGKSADSSAPAKISGGVMAGNILTQVMPKYPEAAKAAKIQGAVVLHAIVGKDGLVENLQVVSGPEELRRSALDAVQQWTYKPYVLNGAPVEVDTNITVTYSLQP